ncbi:MAG: DUF6526 family protein [Ignavibacteria bacterium]|jgi:hypothetical protein|nr:DUF6526 family protein [Ignavibacteria bacterium]
MKEQNYKNHRRFVIGYHVITVFLIFLVLVSSLYYVFATERGGLTLKSSEFLFLISLVLLLQYYYLRSFALKAQDRAIRAEENFRHYLLTGKPLDSRLTIRQIIGLRFASDEEFPELAMKAAESGMSEEDIKKAIKNWKPDTYRV